MCQFQLQASVILLKKMFVWNKEQRSLNVFKRTQIQKRFMYRFWRIYLEKMFNKPRKHVWNMFTAWKTITFIEEKLTMKSQEIGVYGKEQNCRRTHWIESIIEPELETHLRWRIKYKYRSIYTFSLRQAVWSMWSVPKDWPVLKADRDFKASVDHQNSVKNR